MPGRTDNEIKNVWHTHLKKRLEKHIKITPPKSQTKRKKQIKQKNSSVSSSIDIINQTHLANNNDSSSIMSSPQPSSSCEISSSSVVTDAYMSTEYDHQYYTAEDDAAAPPPIDESFWSDDVAENSNSNSDSSNYFSEVKMESPIMSSLDMVKANEDKSNGLLGDEDMEFWYDVFVKAGGISELPEF